MSESFVERPRVRRMLLTCALGALLVSGGACSKERKPEAEEPRTAQDVAPIATTAAVAAASASQSAPTASSQAPKVNAPSEYHEANFELSIKPLANVKSGQPGAVEVELRAVDPFHVNQNYPYKFKLKPSPGIKPDKFVYTAEGVKLEPKRAVMKVGFTPETAGKKQLFGQFLFSVCTDDKCLIEKRDLGLELNVE